MTRPPRSGRNSVSIFPDDIEGDKNLALCSDEAKWFWVRIFLHTGTKSPVYGKLVINEQGVAPSLDEIGKMFGMKRNRTIRLLFELEKNNVFSRDSSGTIYCRRQVREALISEKRSDSASKRWVVVEQSVEDLQCKTACKSDAKCGEERISDPDLNSDQISDQISEPAKPVASLGRSATPLPTHPEDFIPNDATGHEELRELWNARRPAALPACEELERVEHAHLARLLGSDARHRSKAWWVAWIDRTHPAKFLPLKSNGPATFAWFLEQEDRIARLKRGEYDNPPAPKPGTRTEPSTYKRPAGFVDYSKPLDEPRGAK